MHFSAYVIPRPERERARVDLQAVRAMIGPTCRFGNHTLQFLRVMKLTAFLICACALTVSAKSFSQTVTAHYENAPLTKVLRSIQEKSGYSIIFSPDNVRDFKTTFSVKDASIQATLDACLNGLPFTYNIDENKIITIRPAAAPQQAPQPADTASLIRGKIVDEKGEPVAGVSVFVKNSTLGTITDDKGQFSLTTSSNAVLVLTHVGFERMEYHVKNKSTFSITINHFVTALSEVAISYSNGYQDIPKERATGSFDLIDNKLINREVSTDIISRIDGLANSLYFDKRQGGTTPNLAQMTIRGYSSINSNSQPLVVIDNFVFNGDIQTINPNDVQSITVLKDAAATSIWGARAGNGVIVITTKKGAYNQHIKVSVNANTTVSGAPDLDYSPNWIKSTDFINVEQQLFQQGFYGAQLTALGHPPVSPVVALLAEAQQGTISAASASASIDSLRNYDERSDLKKYFYRSQINQQYSVNISGGNSNSAYFLSGGYDKNRNNQVGSDFDRFTMTSGYQFTPFKGFELTSSLSYVENTSYSDLTINEITTGGNYGIYPYAQLADSKGNPLPIVHDYSTAYVNQADQEGFLNWQFFPLQELRNGYNRSTNHEYDTRINLGVKYSPFDGLSAEVRYQYERQVGDFSYLEDQRGFTARNLINEYANLSGTTVSGFNVPVGDILNSSSSVLGVQNARAQLDYSKSWRRNELTFLGGGEINDAQANSNSNTLYGYNAEFGTYKPVDYTTGFRLNPTGYHSTIPFRASESGTTNRFVSLYANAAYTYNKLYTLSLSGRRDASNVFGISTNNAWKPLWSAGLKWDMSGEKFYHFDAMPKLALRTTYGYSGNVNNNIPALATLYYTNNFAFYTNATQAIINNPPNNDLKWENVGMLNVAADIGLKNGILSGSVEYFHKNMTDLLAPIPLDPTAGFGTSLYANSANIKGNGVDVQLLAKEINHRDFRWETSLILSYYRDKVKKYLGTSGPAVASSYVGVPLYPSPVVGRLLEPVYAYRWGGLDSAGNPQGYSNGKLSENYQGIVNDSVYTLKYKGSALPLYFGAMRNNFTWKNWTVSVNIVYKFGFYFHKPTISYSNFFNSWSMNSDYYKRWQKPGDEKITTVPSMDYPANSYRDQFYANAEPNFLRGDNIRLQDINLSYDIRDKLKRIGFSSFQVYLYANNLGLIWRMDKSTKLDPDYGSSIPPSKSIALGLRASF